MAAPVRTCSATSDGARDRYTFAMGVSPNGYCLSETGSLELAIEDPEGRLVPDRRVPAFRFPEWVHLPEFLEPHLAARNSVKVDGLPYRIQWALHFSNGGGLYVGEHIQTGARVVLKEARPYAGLDMDGTDAVTRLRRERKMLERLAGPAWSPRLRQRVPMTSSGGCRRVTGRS